MESTLLILVFGGTNYTTVPTPVKQFSVNKSMQVGDVIYKVTPSSSGGITTADINGSSTLEKIGVIKQIVDWNNGNGATGTNYGNINGDNTNTAYAMFPIDLNGDGVIETGDNNTYWANNTEISWNVDNSIITTGHGSYAVVIDIEGYESIVPTVNDYYFFSKDNNVNMSSITGYYAEVEFENNSTNKAEFFAKALLGVNS